MSTDHAFRHRLDELDPDKRDVVLDALYAQRVGELREQPRPRVVPISPAQQRLWYLAATGSNDPSYNIPGFFAVHGHLDPGSLRQALRCLVARHEMLRSGVVGEDPPLLDITEDLVVPLEVWDRRTVPVTESDARHWAASFLRGTFVLDRAPLWRALLIRVDEDTSYLVLSFHHIVFDGWSLGVFVKDLLAALAGETLPEQSWQFPDYALWERRRLQLRDRIDALRANPASDPGPGLGRADRFWRDYLADLPAPTEIAADTASDGRGTTAPTNNGALLVAEVPSTTWNALVELARGEGATPFATALAALVLLLHRRSGQDDLVVGTPVSGRADPQVADLIGNFVNTIPVRTRVDPHMSPRELLAAVARSSLDAFTHEEVPFERIVEVANPPRSAAVHPVFQLLLSFQPAIDVAPAAGLRLRYLDLDFGTAKFDLSLDVVEDRDTVRLLFEYNTDRLHRGIVQDLAASYAAVVEEMGAHPDTPLSQLPVLTREQRGRALEISRGPRLPAADTTVSDAVATHAALHPGDAAVTAAGWTLTYRELDRSADEIASRIVAARLSSDVLGILLPRSCQLVATVVGVWRAGKTCLLLDPSLPTERIEAMVLDAGATLLTEQEQLLDRPMLGRGATPVAILADLADHPSRTRPQVDRAENAYIVYTSGSTGQPKGVAISHGAYAAMLTSWTETFELDRPRTLQIAASSFDVFYGDLARTLGTGGHLHVVDPVTVADPARFAEGVRGQTYDFAEFVPSVFRRIAAHQIELGQPLDIRTVVVASEPWDAREAQNWLGEALAPGSRLYNTYGVAEATVDSTVFEVTAESVLDRAVPIGTPLPNTEVYLLDDAGQPVASGTRGRILVGGPTVGQGYVGGGATQNTRFAEHDVGDGPVRLYDTGDLGYRDASGQLVLAGRRDDQVKVRGVRIELGEIEHAVRSLDGVAEVAVVLAGDRLVAWVKPYSAVGAAAIEGWRRVLARSLPSAMLPQVVLAPDLPHLSSGKVDRQALGRRPVPHEPRRAVAPRGPAETRLSALFAEVLQQDDVGVTDSFFALGGHSLTALHLVSRVCDDFAVNLRIGDLFDHPSVETLAARIEDMATTERAHHYPRVEPDLANRHDPFPLTDVQQAYWLGRDSVFEFSGVATHSYDEFTARGLDPDRFARALNRLVERHEMLRAVIVPDDAQRILPEAPEYNPPVYDLTAATEPQAAAHLAQVREELGHQQIDMTCWPTFDIRVSLLPDDRQVLHLSTDALMIDAWGFVTMMRDLDLLYDGVDLSPLDFSFRDYVLAERGTVHSERYERSKEYWQQRIPDLPAAPDLPTACRPDDLEAPRYTRHHAQIDEGTWSTLKDRAAARDLTPTTVCLAVYADVLARRVRDQRFSLNLTFLNRKPFHPRVAEVVGEFTSLTLLDVDHAGSASFVERAGAIQRNLWETLEENDISGVKVLRDYARHHRAPTAAHFPVVFTSALAVPVPQTSPTLQVAHVPEHGITQTSQVWLDAGVWEDRGALRCNWDVVLDVYPQGLIPDMFAEYIARLTRLATDPDTWDRPDDAPAPAPLSLCDVPELTLLDLTIESVRKEPDAPAVITPTSTVTYAELAARAARVGSVLRRHGARREDLVGVYMDVGWEQVVAVLGTVTTAAYLPLSVDLPAERLQQVLERAGVGLVLTQPHLRDRLSAAFDGTIMCVDVAGPGEEAVPDPAGALARHAPAPGDLAYVIYTSGSTGEPKGVMIDHRGAVNTILDVNDRFGVGPQDRVLALSALSFDLSVYDIFGMLAAGGAVVMPEPARRLDPMHQRDLVRTHRVSLWNTVPALFGLFVGALDEPCTSLRQVLLSGDWIPLPLLPRARQICPNAHLDSLGGATEASIWSITYPIGDVDPAWTSVPYGAGMVNQDIVVLDRDLAAAATWVTGDLYIRGIGLALGYYRDPDRTAEAFLTHPVTGERLYRTGDLGRLMPDGNIEFLGRSDFQLKIGGYRVEAGDVEQAVLRHPLVRGAHVLALGERHADKRLACAWVPSDPAVADDVDLRAFLETLLPPYMIPLLYVRTDSLPLTSNAKVDRAAVRRLFDEVDVATAPYVAPTTEHEHRMTRTWKDVLGREDVGLHDDFFQIGGDSIGAIALSTALHRTFGRPVPLREVYAARTPASLLKVLDVTPPPTSSGARNRRRAEVPA